MPQIKNAVVVATCTLLAELAVAVFGLYFFTSFAVTGSGGLGAISFGIPEMLVLLLTPALAAGISSALLNRSKSKAQ